MSFQLPSRNLNKLLPWMLISALAIALWSAPATAQRIIVQVDLASITERSQSELDTELEPDDERGGPIDVSDACSILEVGSGGMLTELVSNSDILAVTGETSADCSDTGLAIASDGTIYFGEDESHDILRLSSGGILSVFAESADIDSVVGTTSDNDNGMAVGPSGTLFVADEDCDCIYTISSDGSTITEIITEAQIGTATGNRDDSGPRGSCGGSPVADLEGGLAVASDGTIYFADEGGACNISRPGNADLESILVATPNGVGGYNVSILKSEDDLAVDLPASYPGSCFPSLAGFDLDLELAANGLLYVLDDGSCEGNSGTGDKILAIDPSTGTVTLITDEAAVAAVTGSEGADFEGGIGIFGTTLFVGDSDETLVERGGGGPPVNSNDLILRVDGSSGDLSVHVSNAELRAFYATLYPQQVPQFTGGLTLDRGSNILEIPTNNLPGKLALIGALGLLALLLLRRL